MASGNGSVEDPVLAALGLDDNSTALAGMGAWAGSANATAPALAPIFDGDLSSTSLPYNDTDFHTYVLPVWRQVLWSALFAGMVSGVSCCSAPVVTPDPKARRQTRCLCPESRFNLEETFSNCLSQCPRRYDGHLGAAWGTVPFVPPPRLRCALKLLAPGGDTARRTQRATGFARHTTSRHCPPRQNLKL